MRCTMIVTPDVILEMERISRDDPARVALFEMVRQYRYCKERYVAAMKACQRTLVRELAYVAMQPVASNSLGVLQAQGVEVDRLAGELNQVRRAIGVLENVTGLCIAEVSTDYDIRQAKASMVEG